MEKSKQQRIVDEIAAGRIWVDELSAQERRALSAANQHRLVVNEFGRLRTKRESVAAEAFMRGVAADFAEVDQEIAALQAGHRKELEEFSAASAVMARVGPEIDAEMDRLRGLERELNRMAAVEIERLYTEARQRYEDLAGEVKVQLAKMLALGEIHDSFTFGGGSVSAEARHVLAWLSGNAAKSQGGLVTQSQRGWEVDFDLRRGLRSRVEREEDDYRGQLADDGFVVVDLVDKSPQDGLKEQGGT